MSDSWEVRVVVLASVVAAVFLKLIYDRVDAMLKEIKGLRWQLEETEKRLKDQSKDLSAIRQHTRPPHTGPSLWDKASEAAKNRD